MNTALFLAIVCGPIGTDPNASPIATVFGNAADVMDVMDFNHFDLLVAMQGRISLRSGPGGGVTITPDPAPARPSYDHRSQPLFGSQSGYAVRRSRQRSAPPLITSREVAREAVRASAFGGARWRF
jgi:hypothetical protein